MAVESPSPSPTLPPILDIHGNVIEANTRQLAMAYSLRELAFQSAHLLFHAELAERETKSARAQATAALVKAWDVTCNRARIAKGRGEPKSVQAVNDPERNAGKSSKRKPAIPLGPSKP